MAPCPICLETGPLDGEVCVHCGEPLHTPHAPEAQAPRSTLPDERPGAGFLEQHWRPLITLGSVVAIVLTGVVLRVFAPDRFTPPSLSATRPPVPSCVPACWNGEACEAGRCVWQPPNDVGHIENLILSGPFPLARDASDVLPLDAERLAVALLAGAEIRSSKTGEILALVSDAPHTRALHRVQDAVYAVAPQRIFVIDPASTRLQKTLEVGGYAEAITVGASGRRAMISLPTQRAVAIVASEYHAEIDRIHFGDDAVRAVGVDDTGTRALTTSGKVPLLGLTDPAGGAVYAFNPGLLASAQDRVRTSVGKNPVDVLMTPDGATSFVVVRGEGAVVPLAWLPSGAVRREERIPTCAQPEQIQLVRRGRRAAVRCFEGRALVLLDLMGRQVIARTSFNARAADMAVTPDGRQALVVLRRDGEGALALVDLETLEVRSVELDLEPNRVRLAPDGRTAVVFSDRSKVAWVVR